MFAILLGVQSQAKAQELVTNGDFEANTDFNPPFAWSGTGAFAGNFNQGVHSGAGAAYFGAVGTLDSIAQNIATTPGQTYTFSWWMAGDGGTPSQFRVSWDGTVISDVFNVLTSNYQFFSFTETASAAITTIQFEGRNDPSYLGLDDVSVMALTPVPEPSSILFSCGLGLAGLAIYRRKRSQVA